MTHSKLKLNSKYEISIVMGTYNGEKYIEEQLDSIIHQTYKNWCLLIRDDGSTDNTLKILKAYAKQHPQIILLTDKDGNLGFNQNFLKLIEATATPYISISDQDDVWLPHKLALSLNALKSTETSSNIPAVVHSDAFIVDSKLNRVAEKWIGRRGNIEGLNGIAFANSVQGASLMFNRALKEIALETPLQAPYDYHLALIAVSKGKRYFIDESLLHYRQHANNVIGGMNVNSKININHYLKQFRSLLSNLFSALDYDKLSSTMKYSIEAYNSIKNNYCIGLIVDDQIKPLEEYLYIFEGNSTIKKVYIFMKNRYGFSSKKDYITFLLLILFGRDLKNPSNWK